MRIFFFLLLLFPALSLAMPGTVVLSYSGSAYSPLSVSSSSCADVSTAFMRWINNGSSASCSTDPLSVGSRITVAGFGTVVVDSISATSLSDDLVSINARISALDQFVSAISATNSSQTAQIQSLESKISTLESKINSSDSSGTSLVPFDQTEARTLFLTGMFLILSLYILSFSIGKVLQLLNGKFHLF